MIEFIDEVAGIYFRSIVLEKTGDVGEQHQHDHDHATYCGNGAAEYWVNGAWQCNVKAGHAIEVKAGQNHKFIALEDNTRLTCVHDVKSAESIKEKGV